MNLQKLLYIAGVPAAYQLTALAALEHARTRASGLLWHKIKCRYGRAPTLGAALPWSAERLPVSLAQYDIAPMVNITANGDNAPWGADGKPASGQWLNADPASDEYAQAVASCYWCEGQHPRSAKARRAWYRRNAGEHEAWARGMPITTAAPTVWQGGGDGATVKVLRSGDAWQLIATRKLIGPLVLHIRVGYEIDNVVREDGTQLWYPVPGADLRAPVTWSVLPGWEGA